MQRTSPSALRASPEGKDFIKSWEELRLKSYDDGAGYLTVGWGHRTDGFKGEGITKALAEAYFASDVRQAEGVVRLFVKVPLAIHEYDALTSFAFNVGGRNFGTSTLRRVLNELDYEEAAWQLLRWNKAGGKEMKGLVRRRAAEKLMFTEGRYNNNK
jgi:lysozyme